MDRRDSEVVEAALRSYLGLGLLDELWAAAAGLPPVTLDDVVHEQHAARAEQSPSRSGPGAGRRRSERARLGRADAQRSVRPTRLEAAREPSGARREPLAPRRARAGSLAPAFRPSPAGPAGVLHRVPSSNHLLRGRPPAHGKASRRGGSARRLPRSADARRATVACSSAAIGTCSTSPARLLRSSLRASSSIDSPDRFFRHAEDTRSPGGRCPWCVGPIAVATGGYQNGNPRAARRAHRRPPPGGERRAHRGHPRRLTRGGRSRRTPRGESIGSLQKDARRLGGRSSPACRRSSGRSTAPTTEIISEGREDRF